jgi:hypothetical protein
MFGRNSYNTFVVFRVMFLFQILAASNLRLYEITEHMYKAVFA